MKGAFDLYETKKTSKECKLQVVKEALEVGNKALEVGNKALVARRYDLSPNLVQRWVKAYEEGQLGEETVNSSSAEVKGWRRKTNSLRSY